MAFRPYNPTSSYPILEVPADNGGSSVTYTIGDAVTINADGQAAAATSSTATDIIGVVTKTATISTDGNPISIWVVHPGQLWEADTDAAWAQTDIGTFVDLASVSTINPDASTHDVFYLVKGVGTAGTDTKVIGFFTKDVTAA